MGVKAKKVHPLFMEYDAQTMVMQLMDQPFCLVFYDRGMEVGRLGMGEDAHLVFSGTLSRSARAFFSFMKGWIDTYMQRVLIVERKRHMPQQQELPSRKEVAGRWLHLCHRHQCYWLADCLICKREAEGTVSLLPLIEIIGDGTRSFVFINGYEITGITDIAIEQRPQEPARITVQIVPEKMHYSGDQAFLQLFGVRHEKTPETHQTPLVVPLTRSCPACQKEVFVEDRFCRGCGTPLMV